MYVIHSPRSAPLLLNMAITQVKKAKKAPWEASRFMDATTEVSLVQLQVIDKEPAKLDDHEHVEYVLMDHSDVEVAEHLVPTKVTSKPDCFIRYSQSPSDRMILFRQTSLALPRLIRML